MKNLAVVVSTLVLSLTALGQGQFTFNNRSLPTVDARFHFCSEQPASTILAGDAYTVEILARPEGGALQSMATTTFRSGAAAGYVNSVSPIVPGTSEGTHVTVTLRLFQGAVGTASDVWVQRSPVPTANSLLGVAYGNDTHVAVGANGTILSSRDSVAWVQQRSPITNHLRDVAFGEGRFVAVGEPGLEQPSIISSIDGRVWTTSSQSPNLTFSSITHGNGRFVAVSRSGHAAVSTNGLDWLVQDVGQRPILLGIGFGNGIFVALADFFSNPTDNQIMISPDGLEWTEVSAPRRATLFDVAYGAGQFVIVGTDVILVSADGRNWTEVPAPGADFIRAVTATPSGFVAVGAEPSTGYGVVLRASDGPDWTRQVLSIGSHLAGVVCTPDQVVAVGSQGSILTSAEGPVWTSRRIGTSTMLRAVSGTRDRLVAVGSRGTILTSSDGLRWAERVSSTTHDLNGVAHGAGRWVAVGRSGAILTSDDSESWTLLQADASGWFESVVYAQDVFVAVGNQGPVGSSNARVWTSPDGLTWTDRSPLQGLGFGSEALTDVVFSSGWFLAVGPGSMLISDNALVWQNPSSGRVLPLLRSIAHGSGLFVGAGLDGIHTSTNLVDWVRQSWEFVCYDVEYFDGSFWLVAEPNTQRGYAVILKSADGVKWDEVDQGFPTVYNISRVGDTLVTVGDAGTIRQSTSAAGPTRLRSWESRLLRDGSFALMVEAPPGATVSIEATSDLRSWNPLITATNWLGRDEVVDRLEGSAHRFYRAKTE